MKILYVAPKFDYGKPEQGFSFEHYNFYDFLDKTGHEILYFDSLTLLKQLGKEPMNRRLLEMARTEHPDLMFTVLFTDELDPATVARISSETGVTTLNWFCDDHWRFENYSRHWAPSFNWVVTTAKSAVEKYRSMGYSHAIKSQWGCNHLLYRKLGIPFKYEVTFVGQPHGNRRQIIQTLRDNGIRVQTFGAGWDSGRVSQEDMIRIFNESRINLNLSNASIAGVSVPNPVMQSVLDRVAITLDHVPFGPSVKRLGRKVFESHQKAQPDDNGVKQFEQIKGRNFEVPGCGGFVLTGNVEDLDNYYESGKEVVSFKDTRDLVDKIKYYLSHEQEREAIANAGYERTLREHTYTHRFRQIFAAMQLAERS